MGAKEPPARCTQRLCHFFLSDFQSSYPIVQEILYKEEEGIRYFPTGVRLVSAFIHLSLVDEGSFAKIVIAGRASETLQFIGLRVDKDTRMVVREE
jgi:hypothetical protein